MKKFILIVFIILMVIIVPIKVSANNINYNNKIILIADDNNQIQECTGDNSILGNINDANSVAWLLQHILDYLKVIGPILVVVLSSVEFAKVIINNDDEAMGKAQKKLIVRIVLAACLFFIPTLVEVILDLFGFTSNSTCGIK